MNNALSVTQVNRYIKNMIEGDLILSDILLQAEVSNLKAHSSGHIYLTLKDEASAISCVIFSPYSRTLSFDIKDGLNVLAYGRIGLYEKTGQYQLYINYIQPLGKGDISTAYEQLKNKLEQEGLFDSSHKKKLPQYPKKIGIITSSAGAVVHDIIRVAGKRNKTVELILIPALVQGKEAPLSISGAIQQANKYKKLDLIILARGGGSSEDLSAFNDENVVRSIYKSKIPIISAVGHETDFTLSDFVADMRAATPSAAAEIAIPDAQVISDVLYKSKAFLYKRINRLITEQMSNLTSLAKVLSSCVHNNIEIKNMALQHRISSIKNLSPIFTLQRGYSIVSDEKNEKIKSINEIEAGQTVKISFSDGNAYAKIVSKDIQSEKLNF